MFVVSPFLDAETVRAAANGEAPRHVEHSSPLPWSFSGCYAKTIGVFKGFDDLRDPAAPGSSGRKALTFSMKRAKPPSKSLKAKKSPPPACTQSYYSLRKENAASFGWAARTQRNVDGKAATSRLSQSSPSRTMLPMASRNSSLLANDSTPTPRRPKTDEDEEALERRGNSLSGRWPLRQRSVTTSCKSWHQHRRHSLIPQFSLRWRQWAAHGTSWPRDADLIFCSGLRQWQRTDFRASPVWFAEKGCAHGCRSRPAIRRQMRNEITAYRAVSRSAHFPLVASQPAYR